MRLSVCLAGKENSMDKFYAHSLAGRPKEEWQGLEEH